MNNDIISGVVDVKKMTKEEKKKERERRDRNLKELLDKNDTKKLIERLVIENEFLKKRNKVLETIEANIKMQVEKHKDKKVKPNYYDAFVKLSDALDYEREQIYEQKNKAEETNKQK